MGIVHKEFTLAGQTVNSAYYCDISRRLRENVRTPRPKLWRHKDWPLHYDNTPSHTSLFTREFFTKKDINHLPLALLFSVSQIEDRTERPHFATTEVIEAESQVVLNTFTEHDF
jgi:hypothetical protein